MAVVDEVLIERIRLNQLDELVRAQSATAWEALRIAEQLGVLEGVVVNERARIADVPLGNMIAQLSLRDAFRFAEQLYQAHILGVTEGIGIAQTEQTAVIWQIIEQLGIVDTLDTQAIYRATFRDTIRLVASLLNFYALDLTDEIVAGDDPLSQVLAQVLAQDTVGIETTLQPVLLLNAVAEDGIELDAIDAIQMLFNPTVREGIELKAGYLGPDGSFTTWAMNTRTGAVTEYANYAFNSFAKIGRRYLGASENGLYELLGDDDAGEDIVARIRGGFLQFGGTQLSRLKEAYLAARGEQEWVLRVVTGDDTVYAYRVTNRSMRSTKIHMGKGQRARYFAYELISAGEDFDLDTLEFVPLVVQRRV